MTPSRTTYLAVRMLLLLLLLSGCSDSRFAMSPRSDTCVSVTLDAVIPGFNFTGGLSRSLTSDPDPSEMKIHILIFDSDGLMLGYIKPRDIEFASYDPSSGSARFNIKNFPAGRDRVIHVIATGIDDLTDPGKVIGAENISSMACESSTMPSLVIGNDNGACWGRCTLPVIDSDTRISVRLLRNYCGLSVDYTGSDGNFELLGYTVANRPAIGTVTPYLTDGNGFFSSFFDPPGSPSGYGEILDSGYHAVSPSDILNHLDNTTPARIEQSLTLDPVYFYERPGGGTDPTYVIIKGRFKGTECFYRAEIGSLSDKGFVHLDLLRNFHYTMNITGIYTQGTTSVEEAMRSIPINTLSNTTTIPQNIYSINRSGFTVEISQPRLTIVTSSPQALRFRYLTEGLPADPSGLSINNVRADSRATSPGNLDHLSGDVIKEAVLESPDAEGWHTLRITPNEAPATGTLTQEISIAHSSAPGFDRTVTLVRRNPWTPEDISHSGNPSSTPMSRFDIIYGIPAGLDESLFPLDIIFESDKQNIVTTSGSPLSVEVLPQSGFAGGSSGPVIAYSRRVEWSEYAPYAATGLTLTNPFILTSDSNSDSAYPTGRIDLNNNPGREANNSTGNFAIRISDSAGYIAPAIENIRRTPSFGPVTLGWDNLGSASSDMPAENLIPSNKANAPFTLFYRLPADLTESEFTNGKMDVTISSSIALNPAAETPHGLRADGDNFLQTISYQEYTSNPVFSAPFLLPAGASPFDISVSPASLATATATVTRTMYKIARVVWDNKSYTENYTIPQELYREPISTNYTIWSLYYRFVIPESGFGDGILFTIRCSENYLQYDRDENRPFDLTISDDGKTATQFVKYQDYKDHKYNIIAPFRLKPSEVTEFTISVSASIVEESSIEVYRGLL